jgi:hypothetical protein
MTHVIRATGTTLVLLCACALMALPGCGDDDDGGPEVETATFRATWMITQPSGQATTCDAAGIASISFLFTDSSAMGYDDVFTCALMTSLTDPLPLDDFTFVATALDATDMPIAGIATVSNDASLMSCADTPDCIVPLPAVNLHQQ